MVFFFSTGNIDRQKLSFGVQTNLTNSKLFETTIKLEENKSGSVQVLVNSVGNLIIVILKEETEIARKEVKQFISDNHWHRVNVVVQNQKVKVHVDGVGGQIGNKNWKKIELTSNIGFGKLISYLIRSNVDILYCSQ